MPILDKASLQALRANFAAANNRQPTNREFSALIAWAVECKMRTALLEKVVAGQIGVVFAPNGTVSHPMHQLEGELADARREIEFHCTAMGLTRG